MKVYYALYDQSYDNNAQYWTWFPGEITQQMRDAIASKSGAFQMRPKRPNLLTEPDIVGGIINYQDQWCVVYRYFNGGNDPQGRPDRCVLATAWVRTEEAQGQNLLALLFCPVFLDVQRQALFQCPVQVPRALVENCNYPVSQNDPQFVIYKNNPNIASWSFRNANEVEVIGKLFPLLIEDGLKSLQVLQSAAYMETFSGTPLASGITYVPKVVIQPEQPEYVGGYDYSVQQPQRRYTTLVFLLGILFILTSLVVVNHLTNNTFIDYLIQQQGFPKRHLFSRHNLIRHKQVGQVQNEQVQNGQGRNGQGRNGQGPNVPSTTVPPTTVPPTTVPPTTVPPTTVPPTTVPPTTVPSTTVPPTTVPPTTVPPTTVPPTTVPPTTVPPTTVPPTTVPPTTVPPTTVPPTTVPSTTVPPTTVPSTTVPPTTVPSTNVQTSNVQIPNVQESGRPLNNSPMQPNNGASGLPLIEL